MERFRDLDGKINHQSFSFMNNVHNNNTTTTNNNNDFLSYTDHLIRG